MRKIRAVIILWLILLLLLGWAGYANAQDQKDFCTAAIETAKSQAAILRSPQAVVGVTQSPLAGAAAQSIAGFSESVQGLRKANATELAARATCNQYKAVEDASITAQYITLALEANALSNRLSLDYRALTELDNITSHAENLMSVQNTTRPSVYAAQSAITKVQSDITSTLTALALIQIPDQYKGMPLEQLLELEQAATAANQDAQAKVLTTQNWDLQLSVGARHTLLPLLNPQLGAYGGFNFTYNLGGHKSDQHLAVAAAASKRWDAETVTGSAYLIKTAREQMRKTLSSQTDRLKALEAQQSVIAENLKAFDGVDTTAANVFRSSLETDRILLRVERADTEFRISELDRVK